MTTFFALDIGNKQTKLVSAKESFVFPSVLINKRDNKSIFAVASKPRDVFELKLNGEHDSYYMCPGVFNFPKDRLLDSVSFEDRYGRKVYHQLNEFGLGILAKDMPSSDLEDVKIVVGLPTGDYTVDTINEIKSIFLENVDGEFKPKTHLVTVDGKEVLTKVTSVTTLPQPIGTFYNEIFDEQLNLKDGSLVQKRIAIVDAGGGTLLLDQLSNANLEASNRVQLPSGANSLYSQISADLMQDYRLNADLHKIETMIREGLKGNSLQTAKFVYRQSDSNIFNVTDIVVSAIDHYTNTVINHIFTTFQNLREVDAMIITGGTSSILNQKLVKKAFGKSTKVIFVKNPETANAKGFYKYALLQEQN